MRSIVVSRTDDILAALRFDLGRADLESYLSEIHFVKAEIDHVLKHAKRWASPKRVGAPFYHWPSRSYVVAKPKGVVLNLAPWNYPFQISVAPAISALAAGNAVMIKPSEQAPKTAALLGDLFSDPVLASVVSVATGGAKVAEELLQLPWDHVFFTGSRAVGKKVLRATSERLASTTLELSGNNLGVADASADLSTASRRIALGRFMNAGQTCVAPNALLVPASTHDAWIEALSRAIRGFYGEDVSKCPDFGRLISKERVERLEAMIPGRAIRFGTTDPSQRRLAPAIVPHCNLSDEIVREETFGPVLPIVPYESLDDLAKHRESFVHSLACYVFTSDREFARSVEAILEPASLCVNDVLKQSVNLRMPFGGRGRSGHGRYRGEAGFLEMSHLQAQTWRSPKGPDPFAVFPPYKSKLDFFKRWL